MSGAGGDRVFAQALEVPHRYAWKAPAQSLNFVRPDDRHDDTFDARLLDWYQ